MFTSVVVICSLGAFIVTVQAKVSKCFGHRKFILLDIANVAARWESVRILERSASKTPFILSLVHSSKAYVFLGIASRRLTLQP